MTHIPHNPYENVAGNVRNPYAGMAGSTRPPFRGIPVTKEGLIWRRAHEIKRKVDQLVRVVKAPLMERVGR